MKRIDLIQLILVLILGLIMAGCNASASTVEAPVIEEGPIVIGASLTLSGRFDEPGQGNKQGYEIWAAMVNESGGLLGRQIELIILDNESDPELASAQYEKLITEDKVDLVVGPFSSLLVIPTSEVAARYGYAFIEPAGGSPEVFNRGLKNVFFAQSAVGARQADPFALHVLNLRPNLRPQTFAIVSQSDPYTSAVMERFRGLLTEVGMELVFDVDYPPDETDFSDIANQVAALDPDLIIGGTLIDDSIAQIQAYQAVGYQPRFAYFTSGPAVPGPFRGALGPATEGVFSSISWFPEAKEYQNAEFVARYLQTYGGSVGEISEDAANAFTVGQVLQQAVENIDSIDNAVLIEELHRGNFKTIVGDLRFDATGAPQGSSMLLQWQGDNFVIVGPRDRAELDPLPGAKPEW